MKNQFYIVEIHLGEVEKRGLVGKDTIMGLVTWERVGTLYWW